MFNTPRRPFSSHSPGCTTTAAGGVVFNSDNFTYVGARTMGAKAAHYAITELGWKGALPKELDSLSLRGTSAASPAKDLPPGIAAQ